MLTWLLLLTFRLGRCNRAYWYFEAGANLSFCWVIHRKNLHSFENNWKIFYHHCEVQNTVYGMLLMLGVLNWYCSPNIINFQLVFFSFSNANINIRPKVCHNTFFFMRKKFKFLFLDYSYQNRTAFSSLRRITTIFLFGG